MFPLLQNLLQNLGDTSALIKPDITQVHSFVKWVKDETEDQVMEIIYVLIRAYQLEIEKNNVLEMPYHLKRIKSGIKFDFDAFPIVLQHVLIAYQTLHQGKNNPSS